MKYKNVSSNVLLQKYNGNHQMDIRLEFYRKSSNAAMK